MVVTAFLFSGYEGLATEAELQALVADNIGKTLDLAALQKVTKTVTAYLREEKGFLLARAYLPSQDITDGIVKIAVIAGRIDGGVGVDVKAPRRVRQSLLEKIAEGAAPAGSAIRLNHLERAVLLMNDLPGLSARAAMEPGSTPGSTKVQIDAVEGPLLSGLISGDNFGDRYTGTWRGRGQVAVNDPFGFGDQFSLNVTAAARLSVVGAGYSLPLGASGLTWSISGSHLSYELGKEFDSLNAEGSAETLGTHLGYPLIRTRRTSVWAQTGAEHLIFRDEMNGTDTSDRRIWVGDAGFYGSFLDSFGGAGLSSVSFSLYCGDVDLSGVAAAEAEDASGPRTAGDFCRATYTLARLQRLTGRFSLFGSIRGQFADGNLDSSQQFILGGPTGVRAYPVGEASGDEGHALTLETRCDLPSFSEAARVQLVGFIDSGWVKLHKKPWAGSITNATGRNDYWLSGGGVGLNVGKTGVYTIRLSYAHKIGNNPGRDDAGNDSDNRSHEGRFWLQAVAWF